MRTPLLLLLLLCAAATAHDVKEFSELRVLCVACSSGIGASAAKILLEGGAKVVVSSRRVEACQTIVEVRSQLNFGVPSAASFHWTSSFTLHRRCNKHDRAFPTALRSPPMPGYYYYFCAWHASSDGHC